MNNSIRFGLAHGQQNVRWNQLRDFCVAADQLGYDTLWTCDHFYPIAGADSSGTALEGWTDETCRIVKSMFTAERTTFRGRHYEVTARCAIQSRSSAPRCRS